MHKYIYINVFSMRAYTHAHVNLDDKYSSPDKESASRVREMGEVSKELPSKTYIFQDLFIHIYL